MAAKDSEAELVEALTTAVYAGDIQTAQNVVIQLANLNLKLDINIVQEQRDQMEKPFKLTVEVEDRESSGASFDLMVRSTDKIGNLKKRVSLNYKLPVEVQRWIIGKKIREDNATLGKCGIQSPTTVFLYLLPAHFSGLQPESGGSARYEDYRDDRRIVDDSMSEYPTVSNRQSLALLSNRSLMEINSTLLEVGSCKSVDVEETRVGYVNPLGYRRAQSKAEVDNNVEKEPTKKEDDASWACPKCTLKNSASSLRCETCSYAIPDEAKAKSVRPLEIGERVVWAKDGGNEIGTVKWIGNLPDVEGDNTTVGIEFDNPVGVGTGQYKNSRLFYARKGHAALVPMIGLFRENEMEKRLLAQNMQ